MKFIHFYKFILLISFFSFFFITLVNGKTNIEDEVKKITLELRCMTCQNQSIYDSEAEFSNDIKDLVKSKLNEGKSEREIKEFLVDRYGEYILFRPMLNFKNMFLWGFPFILLTISLFFIVYKARKKYINSASVESLL